MKKFTSNVSIHRNFHQNQFTIYTFDQDSFWRIQLMIIKG